MRTFEYQQTDVEDVTVEVLNELGSKGWEAFYMEGYIVRNSQDGPTSSFQRIYSRREIIT